MSNKKNLLLILIFFLLAMACKKEMIEPPEKVVLEYEVSPVTAFNGSDGAISTSITGSDGPFTYFWSTGDTTSSVSGLTAGEYSVRVVYGSNSLLTATIEVTQPDPEELELSFNVIPVSRFGKADGVVELTVSGGTGPYTAIWNGGLDTTLLLTEATAGVYTVEVTDNSQPFVLTGNGTVEVTQPEFICGTDSIADVDGNLYATVQIENQCWFKKNLVTTTNPDGVTPIDGRFCAGSNCLNDEGAHYTWEAMMNGEVADREDPYSMVQGICPDGWYIPSRKVFQDLDSTLNVEGNYGEGFFSGAKMKGEGSSSGFDALYAGNWGYGVYLNDDISSFWTGTEFFFDPDNPQEISIEGYYFLLTDDTPFLSSGHKPKEFGMSVRCMKLLDN